MTAPGGEEKIYLRGLYGFRFLAALSVFYGHLEQAKGMAGLPVWAFTLSPNLMSEGVTCFFVLSGFLITYLLLSEDRKTGGVDIRSFYVRRVLRIWPLYYAWTFLVFFVFPFLPFMSFPALGTTLDGHFGGRLAWFLLLSPQIAVSLYSHPPFGGPLWSVGVEEYFYFTWPLLLKGFSRKTLVFPLLAIALALPVLRAAAGHFAREGFTTFLSLCRLDCMAVGALFAWAWFEKRAWLEALFRSKGLQALFWVAALKHVVWGGRYGLFTVTVFSLVYALLIVTVALNPAAFFSLEGPVLRFLGEISYGFYVFHWAVNVCVINFFIRFVHVPHGALEGVSIFAAAFGATTALSAASYYWIERRFIALKPRVLGWMGPSRAPVPVC